MNRSGKKACAGEKREQVIPSSPVSAPWHAVLRTPPGSRAGACAAAGAGGRPPPAAPSGERNLHRKVVRPAAEGERLRHLRAPRHLAADGGVRGVEVQHRLRAAGQLVVVPGPLAVRNAVVVRVEMDRRGGADQEGAAVPAGEAQPKM